MPDEIDHATDAYNEWLENKIDNQRLKSDAAKCLPVGTCYNCGDPVEADLVFCKGGECRDDYQRRMKHAEINGCQA